MAANLIAGLMQHREKETQAIELAVDPMPDEGARVFAGALQKCPFSSPGSNWRHVYAVLTEDCLYLAQGQTARGCMDKILLCDVEEISGSEPLTMHHDRYRVIEIRKRVTTGAAPGQGQSKSRRYQFRIDDEDYYSEWLKVLQTSKEKDNEKYRLSGWQKFELAAKRAHDSDWFQQFFGAVIMANFIVSLVQSELIPADDTVAHAVFEILDYVFTALFTVELLVTIVGHCGLVFFRDGWRIFDTLIVGISLLAASGLKMPAVKSVRAIRVLRAGKNIVCVRICMSICICIYEYACVYIYIYI